MRGHISHTAAETSELADALSYLIAGRAAQDDPLITVGEEAAAALELLEEEEESISISAALVRGTRR